MTLHCTGSCQVRNPLGAGARWRAGPWLLGAVLLVLAGCASSPSSTPGAAGRGRDGPGANPPPDLDLVADAQPRLEPQHRGGTSKPYEVLGQSYTPLQGDPPLNQRGLASWYGNKFHGRSTATGEPYDMYAMTAAHKTMPLPSYARVRNPANGREVVVRVNDRGPFHGDRVIDLSYTAALRLGLLRGVAMVEVERITYEAIRTGAWRAPAAPGDDDLAAPDSALAPAALLPESAAWLADDAIAEIGRRAVDWPAATRDSPADLQADLQASARSAQRQAAPGFWLQLGAFGQRDGAVDFQQRVAREVDWLAPLMAIFDERPLHRLQAGPYASWADAASAADRVRESLRLVPAIVERR
jgi:rare lipoprotein A